MTNRKKISKNIFLSIFSQAVSLLIGFVLSLIVPKFISEISYSYWQTYLLYVGYVGLLNFGILDGIVLRYSRYDYEQLDCPKLRSQFFFLLSLSSLFACALFLASPFASGLYKIVLVLIGIGIITKNVFGYTTYLLQTTNRINKYVVVVISQRIIYGVLCLFFLFLKKDGFLFYCVADILGDVLAILISLFFNKKLFFGRGISFKLFVKEAAQNISSGFFLLISNWSSMLFVGAAKSIIQWNWGMDVFGKASFAFSVSNLFLTFVTAISIVLFPSLKRTNESELPDMYENIRKASMPVLLFSLAAFFPGCWFLRIWLPKYSESLSFLSYLLPLIVYSAQVSLLTNNYFKVYRKERLMLLINICFVVIGIILYSISAFALNNLQLTLVLVVVVMMGRSIVSEIMISRYIGKKFLKDIVVEFFIICAFYLASTGCSLLNGFVYYLGIMAIYFVLNYKNIGIFLKKRS